MKNQFLSLKPLFQIFSTLFTMNASLTTSYEVLSSMSDNNSASDLKPTLRVVNEEFLKGSEVISDKLSELQNKIDREKQFEVFNVNQRAQFSISSPDRKRGLTSIIENLKIQKTLLNGKFLTVHFYLVSLAIYFYLVPWLVEIKLETTNFMGFR